MFVLVYGLVSSLFIVFVIFWSGLSWPGVVCCIWISCTIRVIVFVVAICSWNKNVRIWVDIQLVIMSKKSN